MAYTSHYHQTKGTTTTSTTRDNFPHLFVLHTATEKLYFSNGIWLFWLNCAWLLHIPDEKLGSGHVLFLMCWLQLVVLFLSDAQFIFFLCCSCVKCRLLVRGVSVNVSGQAQHFNSWWYSCVSSKFGLQSGGRNIKIMLLAAFRIFTLLCLLGKLPCNFWKLSVHEISPVHLHLVSSSGCVFVFICFKQTPNTLP